MTEVATSSLSFPFEGKWKIESSHFQGTFNAQETQGGLWLIQIHILWKDAYREMILIIRPHPDNWKADLYINKFRKICLQIEVSISGCLMVNEISSNQIPYLTGHYSSRLFEGKLRNMPISFQKLT